MKLESIALHHGYESEKMTKSQQQLPFIKPRDLLLIIHSMGQIYLTSKSREIFIRE